jgi:hypothetical protein
MLHLLGLKFIALFYFVAGGAVGMYSRQIVLGQFAKLNDPEPVEVGMAMLNFILIPCWLAIWNKRKLDKHLTLENPELKAKSLFLQGLPTNQRIALGIWGAAWLIGFVLAAVWDIFG